jgi:hypothetical protein
MLFNVKDGVMDASRFTSVVALFLASSVAHAQPRVTPISTQKPPPGDHRIDPRIRVMIAHWTRTGETLPVYRPSARVERDGVFPFVVRFSTPPGASHLASLAADRVESRRPPRRGTRPSGRLLQTSLPRTCGLRPSASDRSLHGGRFSCPLPYSPYSPRLGFSSLDLSVA